MQLSGKKLTTAILAGLMGATMFGGSVFAEVTDQEFNEVRQGVNSNTQRISQLESAQSAAKDYSKDIDANTTAIANEVTARTDADTKLDTRITNVKEYLENQTAANYVSKTDAAVQDGAVAKAGNTIGENVTNLDGALAKETAARIGADAAQDTAIKQVNDNLVSSVNTINQNIGTITNQLNNNDLAEQQARAAADKAEADARDAADQTLQKNIDAEVTARTDADTKLDTRITNVKEYLENQTAANYVSKTDAAVQDGAVVKAGNTIGENVTNLDGALAKETAARIGADAAQDKVIQQVNQNVANGFNTLNKNIGTITNQLNQNDLAEAQTRAAADQTLQNNIDTNVDNINKNKQNIADIQKTLKDANAVASADATKAATKAANDATAAATNANNVANGLKDRVDLISNNQNVTSESDLIKKDHSIGQNLTNVDAALHKEIADRIGANAKQDEVISNINKNMADGFNAINTNIGTITDQLNKNDLAEQQTRAAADKTLQDNIDAEADARDKAVSQERAERKGADAAQDKVIKQVNDNLVSSVNTINKNVADGFNALSAVDLQEAQTRDAADQKLQKNIDAEATARDQAVAQERAERKGADAAQDKVIKQVNDNLVSSVNTINKNVADGFNALSAVDLQEAQTRDAADQKLQKNIDAEADARDKADQKEAATRQAADQNLQNQINNNSTSINDLYGRYSSLKTDINKVGARSAALAGLHPLDFDPANKLNFAVASGSFKGENSVALGAFYRPNENIMFSAASTMGDSDNAYTFGLSFKIGPSSAKTKTTSPDAEELYKVVGELQDQLAAQQKEIEQLKADKAK